ncbi:MAG: transglutaminase domain-containing protein [Thermoprotei archaeon]|nr:MAG: transglutaminase domain-containing protein [Thermoprotei archaeon]
MIYLFKGRREMQEFMTIVLPKNIELLISRGEFNKAIKIIKNILLSRKDLNPMEKKRLTYEIDRLIRIRYDHPYSFDEALNILRKEIPNISENEFKKLMEERCIDYKIIEGEERFYRRFIANLFFLCPKYIEKSVKAKERIRKRKEYRKKLVETLNKIILSGEGYRNSRIHKVKMTIKVKPNSVPEGEIIRCWIPFPRKCLLQPEWKLISAYPSEYFLAPEDYLQRTIYFEQESRGSKPTIFEIEYEYKVQSYYRKISADVIQEYDENSRVFKENVLEKPPHISFTPYLTRLAWSIVGNERNPYIKAMKIFKWIIKNIRYAYAYDYSTYLNISEYVARNKRGDCGMQGLLFITLCRIVGVPARWQSGWYANPESYGMHDWTQFYVEPYGWLYADPSFANSLTKTMGEIGMFYFGNIDYYRLIFNNDISVQFTPEKKYFRSDMIDSQRGELEWNEENLYYDKWDYEMKIELKV